jgi:hypothetical protein
VATAFANAGCEIEAICGHCELLMRIHVVQGSGSNFRM